MIPPRVLSICHGHPGLVAGAFRVIEAANGQLVFEREKDGERLQFVFNFTRTDTSRICNPKPDLLWSTEAALNGARLMLPPFSAAILKPA